MIILLPTNNPLFSIANGHIRVDTGIRSALNAYSGAFLFPLRDGGYSSV
ncbi:hypothetical protein DDI_1862 [Dickeya dianthicola RNS04.9]|nr:hypothetical protein DDI_1862 [Dickeya dianthicola RNS04.9]